MHSVIRVLYFSLLVLFASFSSHAVETRQQQAQLNSPQCAEDNKTKPAILKQNKQFAKKNCKAKKVYNLSITIEGSGSGRVSSDPAGIYCEVDCGEDYAKNTRIVLSAQPYTGSMFTGWSGACTGTGPCNIKLKEDTTVSASFVRIDPQSFSLVTPYVNESDMREINDFFNAQYDTIPWGRIHDGLDFYPNGNLRPFQAACSGRVKKIYVFDNQVTLIIRCDATYSIDYNFETQAPNTGQIQLDQTLVTEGQLVEQGEVIGYLYSAENPEKAHVHFTLYKNSVPICPEPFFIQSAADSILNLIAVVHQDVVMCMSGNVMPPPMVTPYFIEADMAKITAGFSTSYSLSPWGYPNNGLDMYPQGDLKPFQATCSGLIDVVQLQQTGVDGNWQVEVAVACDEYVMDPDSGGYFIPVTGKYYFETMTSEPAVGQAQLDNIVVAPGQTVTQGDTLGYHKAVNQDAHVHFEVLQFGQSWFQVLGVSGIPLCPEAHFSLPAQNSILNLLHTAWPGAEMCYE
jgi:murein DD-endopeptidase MepM/ murein hydrolase activator NlpD